MTPFRKVAHRATLFRLLPILALAACAGATDAKGANDANGIAGLPDFATPAWRSAAEFSQITAVRELSDGRVVVIDEKSGVHLIGADGAHLRVVGRKGGGPGEYERPVALLARPGDTTVVVDGSLQRFLVLGPSGEAVRVEPMPAGVEQMDLEGDTAGTYVFTSMVFGADPLQGAVQRVRRVRRGAAASESLFTPRHVPTANSMDKERGMLLLRLMPYAPRDAWRLAPDGSIAIVHAEPFHVEWRAPDGTRTVGATYDYPRIPIPQADRDEEKSFTLPDAKPAFEASWTRLDTAGRVWVPHQKAAGDSVRLWSVFGRDGARVGQAPIRDAVTPLLMGRRGIYAVWYDDDEVPWLELYPWRR